MPPATLTPIGMGIEMELAGMGGGWTDVTPDVLLRFGIEGGRGIRGSSPKDRVAQTGMLNFTLNNGGSNSAGLNGYYSPGHTNRRSGFKIGTGVRASVVIDGTQFVLWTGRITNIEPSTGQYLDKVTEVECRDYMDQLARHRLSGIDVGQDVLEHTAFSEVIDAVSAQPRALEVHDGPDTYSFAHDLIRDEDTVPLTELQRLALSSLSLIWLRGNGTLVYEPRNLNRAVPADPAIDLTESDLRNTNRPTVQDLEDERINLVQTVIAPRREDGSVGSEVVMYRAVQPIQFAAGAGTQQFRGLFTDAGQRAFRAGGINMVTPVSSTDYVFNTAADGSGTDVTSDVIVTATFSGNAVLFAVTNNSGAAAFATTLQVRGVGVLAQEKVAFEDSDADAITARGENALSIEMPYQSDTDVAREASQWMLHVLEQDKRRPVRVPLFLDAADLSRAASIARRDISDVFSFTESMSAFDGSEEFFINAIDFEARSDGTVWMYWTPARADSTNFWLLEVVGNSELGQTTHLGFGFIVGHTDVAHADSHTDTAHSDTAHVDTHTDGAHGDAGHGDAGHGDVAHSDVSHADTHSDVSHGDSAHGDAAHSDSHSDAAHGDVAHSDAAHTDSHNDTLFTDHADHTDTHDDSHTDTHLDHNDGIHSDSHGDVHDDTHDDVIAPHGDVPHFDSHSDAAHADSHTDNAHSDSHNDAAHSDSAHSDSHTDTHTDTAHSDSHTDSAHTDSGHVDDAHGDSHTDTSHSDAAHVDSHDDVSHGDQN